MYGRPSKLDTPNSSNCEKTKTCFRQDSETARHGYIALMEIFHPQFRYIHFKLKSHCYYLMRQTL